MKSNDTEAQSYTPAPIGLRLAAGLIDCLVVAAIIYAILANLGDKIYPALGTLSDIIYEAFGKLGDSKLNSHAYAILCSISLFILYHTIPLWLIQQTPGKALLGLRVTRFGKEPGLLWALGRSSIGYLFVDLFGIGLVVALFKRQTFHDYVFGSAVTIQESGSLNIRNLHARFMRYKEKLLAAEKKNKVIGAVLKYRALYEKLSGYREKLSGYREKLSGYREKLSRSWAAFQSLVGPPVAAATATTAISSAVIATVLNMPVINESLTEPRCAPNCPDKVVEPVVSNFEKDTDGWTISGGGVPKKEHTPGQISAQDKEKGESWWWEAPEAFRGKKTDFYKRQLRFKLKTASSGNWVEGALNVVVDKLSPSVKGHDIVLESSDGLTLVYDVRDHPKENWSSYCVPLDESVKKWHNRKSGKEATARDIQLVLKDLHVLQIRGKYEVGSDTGSLKEVIFGDPIPCK